MDFSNNTLFIIFNNIFTGRTLEIIFRDFNISNHMGFMINSVMLSIIGVSGA